MLTTSSFLALAAGGALALGIREILQGGGGLRRVMLKRLPVARPSLREEIEEIKVAVNQHAGALSALKGRIGEAWGVSSATMETQAAAEKQVAELSKAQATDRVCTLAAMDKLQDWLKAVEGQVAELSEALTNDRLALQASLQHLQGQLGAVETRVGELLDAQDEAADESVERPLPAWAEADRQTVQVIVGNLKELDGWLQSNVPAIFERLAALEAGAPRVSRTADTSAEGVRAGIPAVPGAYAPNQLLLEKIIAMSQGLNPGPQ